MPSYRHRRLNSGTRDGNEVVQKQPEIPQNEYQKSLDAGVAPPPLTAESVRYWSDFNRVFYHPRSIVQLNEYELNSSLMPFEDWGVGEELFGDLDKEHDLLDRDVRPFAEECDQLRALQIFTGSDDAWGGFAARYVDRLRDEYAKTGIWVWAIEDGARLPRHKKILKTSNSTRTLYAVAPQSTLYCPIIDPPRNLPNYLSIDAGSEWYTSALIASAVETVTLPSRLRPYRDFEASLAGQSGGTHKIFELQSSIISQVPENRAPWVTTNENKQETEAEAKTDFDINLTYDDLTTENLTVFNQVQVLRGREPDSEQPPAEDLGLIRKQRLFDSQPMVERYYTTLRFPILDSYPRDLLPRSNGETAVEIHAALSTTTRIGDKLKELQTIAGRTIGVDEREALINGLGELRESYEKGWISDTDDDY
ncbi:MtDNA inheritance protein Dml1 [Rasamsonia emersonii CBS 393.64]|uniref:Protein DML1 n=1 Tax=Rasamsonia emersonii (strain ATCC 16479 / CBS 393.64 / IMI 116815) TaxID=1408163 RepID=A0A0F4Z1D2_RASE3|nr:MtDNA inheritance protein Dml1 [Rasamsonia emersonii CBS 393.64]KKA24155.1 MtDNA inheritance protein Dml1 [Rasamsonia emersonii CBS 393.64]